MGRSTEALGKLQSARDEKKSESRLLTIEGAAQWLAVSTRTIYRLINEGLLPAPLKVRGCSRVDRSDLEAYVNNARGKVRR